MPKNKALIFVYNANPGVENAFLDSIKKIFRPETYDCRLCQLTYGVISENRRWKAFKKESDIEMVFLHKDEYRRSFKSKFEDLYDLPVVLYQDNYDLSLMVSHKELDEIENVEELIQKIKSRL